MRTIVITGAASGIGKALAQVLRSRGERVIGVDLRDAEVIADLSDAYGRRAMIARITEMTEGRVDGVAACAGVAGASAPWTIVSVNFFGAIATLTGLRPMLLRSDAPRAVAVSSFAMTNHPDPAIISACLSGDAAAAEAIVLRSAGELAYPSSKAALSLWIKREAVTADWAGAGIPLNAVAPGATQTPMTQWLLDSEEGRAFLDQNAPTALGRVAQPAEIAELLAFLLSPAASVVVGQTIFCDGGGDAMRRPTQL